jgi:hypothetical protein
MWRAWILAVLTFSGAHAADPSAVVTILEGDALVYRGAARLHAAEGLRLAPGDIVETGPATFTQVEWPDQSMVQFGPATRVMLGTPPKAKPERGLYLMEGWAKLAPAPSGAGSAAASGAPGLNLRAPLFELPASPGVVVIRSSPAEVALFVERGEARVGERQASGPSALVPLRAGDFYRRKGTARGAVAPSPAQDFVAEVPRFFRDSIPLRLERYRDRPVQPRQAGDFSYADVERWLKAEPSVRRPLMQRWRAKAREPAFRSALVANLGAHPEWDPILFPEKYKPKEPSAPRPSIASQRPSNAPVPAY